jgi:hypothetical protein
MLGAAAPKGTIIPRVAPRRSARDPLELRDSPLFDDAVPATAQHHGMLGEEPDDSRGA